MAKELNVEVDTFCAQVEHFRAQYHPFIGNFSPTNSPDEFLSGIVAQYHELLRPVSGLLWQIEAVLGEFRRQQKLAIFSPNVRELETSALGAVYTNNTKLLRTFVAICDDMAALNGCLPQQAGLLKPLEDHLESMVSFMMSHSFVVIQQPFSSNLKQDPLTIFSNAKFEVTVALLFDSSLLSNSITDVGVRLLSDLEIDSFRTQGAASIENRRPQFIIVAKATPHKERVPFLTVHLVHMLTVDINRRGHKPKALPVSEEKFQFLFGTTVEFRHQLHTLTCFSLPVNVLSRKDYRNSYATILWDNAFPAPNRRMFETEVSVPWSRLCQVLSAKFHKDVGVPLKATHLTFIGSMLPAPRPTSENSLVSWEQFAKLTLPHRDFTFFEWFYKILILVREQLAHLYCSGLIHGFISSHQAESLLARAPDGTFLIRFSETIPGAITIAFVQASKFVKLYPWDAERLKKISLSHTIRCNSFLLYLEPMTPKDDVFSPFYVQAEGTRSITGTDYKSDTNIASCT